LTIQTNRTLGGIGACFTLIGAVSSVFSLVRFAYPSSAAASLLYTVVSGIVGFLAFIGFILFLIAMYGFSKDYSEPKIFNYILWGIVVTIIAAVIAMFILIAIVLANITSIIPGTNPSTTSPTQITNTMLSYISPFIAIIGFVGLINIVFNVKAFNLLADKSKVPLFKGAAKVLLAGGLVSIVLGIVIAAMASYGLLSFDALLIVAVPGGLVQYVAWLLLAISFLRISAPPTQPLTSPSASTIGGQVKYCINCGAENQIDAAYCTKCGKKQ
jgi:uncharacterized membrane protein/ribosomal protein L40E